MLFLDAKQTLCSAKLNINYTDVAAGNHALFALADIEDAINYGVRKGWDYKPWPMSEEINNISGSAYGSSGIVSLPKPQDERPQSVFLAVVNGTPWDGQGNGKRNFKDFMKWMSDYPSDTSKIWAEFEEFYYFNGNTGAFAGDYSIDLYGKEAAPMYSSITGGELDDDDEMPFTIETDGAAVDNSGNDAIILYAYAWLLDSEKKKNPNQAALEEKKAQAILDTAWLQYSEGKSQNVPQNRPLFNVPNFFPGRPNRNNTPTGNF